MSNLAKNYLNEFVDAGESNYRSAVRQANIDGNAEYPPYEASESTDRSKWEHDFLNKAKDAWEVYSGKVKVERERVFSEYTTLSEKLERDNERSQGSINKRQKTDLEMLESELGESSTLYKRLKKARDDAKIKYDSVERALNRPVEVSFVSGYLVFMILLAIAEVPVNRLAFELFFESMPAISLLLSAAIGSLFIFFAHIVGKLLKRTRCPVTAKDSSGSYFAIFGICILAFALMFYLGVMREQLVAIEAGSQLNLDELTLDDLMEEPEEQSVFGSLQIGQKGIFLFMINFAIFISGLIAAFFRHDSHPFYEGYDKKYNNTNFQFDSHQKKFEEKQLAILNSYNKEFKGNAEETQEREDKINEIREKRILLDNELKENKELLISEVVRAIKAYMQENKSIRKTEAPAYFSTNVEVLVKGTIR